MQNYAKILDVIDFKRKALILTLAATVSITGSFAAENYKNCLMGLELKPADNNGVNVILNTKTPYEGNISPMRKDASTFVIMMPETDSQAPTPNLTEIGNCVQSVEIRKMPYANGSKGYTKILIKTVGPINLNASTALYIPSSDNNRISTRVSSNEDNARERYENSLSKSQSNNLPNSTVSTSKYQNGRRYENSTDENQREDTTYTQSEPGPDDYDEPSSQENQLQSIETDSQVSYDAPHQKNLVGLWVALIILISVYSYTKTQDKVTNVTGEKLKIDLDNDNADNKQNDKNKHKISRTINKLDTAYSKTSSYMMKSYLDKKDGFESPSKDESDDINIVDLDALFQEQQSKMSSDSMDNDEANALDEFLSGFSFNEESFSEDTNVIENENSYDEELYEKLIENKDIVFSKEDIDCFQNLLQSEINDETLHNIDKYLVSNPVKKQTISLDKKLENLVTDYVINQNITFTSEDVKILKNIISVELDSDFLSDLRTNSKRTNEMEKEINSSEPHKHSISETLTLNVKELLPNLSDALKKQGNKPIVSDYKPDTVYYKEGYEVKTLHINDSELPNLAKEIKNKSNMYISIPSEKYKTVDDSYSDSVDKLSISGLPDLEDVMNHPEKYEEAPKEEFIPDENSLLNSIMNVQFKPFDDGTREFEILNDFDSDKSDESVSTAEIQQEFSRSDNFEVTDTEEYRTEKDLEPELNKFESAYDSNFVDLNEENTVGEEKIISEDKKNINNAPAKNEQNEFISDNKKEPFVPKDLDKFRQKTVHTRNDNPNPLSDMLKKIKSEKKEQFGKNEPSKQTSVNTEVDKTDTSTIKCILNGVNYDIVSTSALNNEIGCHLAKSDKNYVVLAYKGTDLSIIKEFDSVTSERMQTRISETLPDGTLRYLVKVGLNKFIVDIEDGQLKYVMDLC